MKKIIALILVLMMIVPMFTVMVSADATLPDESGMEATYNDGTYQEVGIANYANTTTFADGTYEVTTADDFANMPEDADAVLKGNITITDSYPNTFTGRFIGNGYTITAKTSLFDSVDGAEFENLKINTTIAIDAADIEAVTYNESKGYTGYFVGALANYATACVIKNVDVTGSIDVGTADAGVTVKTGVGSIAGLMDASQAADCDNSAAITVYNSGASIQVSVGGIAGALDGESVLDNCTNGEKLYGQYGTGYGSSSYVFVGGMAGVTNLAGSTSGDDKITIKNCTNTGVIDAERSGGGMIGRCNSSAAKHTYTNNTNTGAVSGNYAAGHIGYTYVISTFKNCSNSGSITSKTDAAGGIVAMSSGSDEIIFENCTNNATGTIAANTYGGGILGYAYNKVKATFTGCSNSASVTSTKSYAGGILGATGTVNSDGTKDYRALDLIFKNCTNNSTGTITGATYAGGIVSYVEATAPVVFDGCKNFAAVTGTGENAGGVLGYAKVTDALSFNKCENHGAVTTNAKKQVGGIVGYIISGYTSLAFTDCDNYGAITANGNSNNASAGGIAGVVGGAGCEFKDCDNYANGSITAEGRSAGIVAWASGTAYTFTNCKNFGTIASVTAGRDGSYSGGIVAVGTQITAIGCYNKGNVSSYLAAGGIAGVVGKASTIQYCLNEGAITKHTTTRATPARNGAAGIVGFADVAVTIEFCGSMGIMTNNDSNLGSGVYGGAAGIAISKVTTTKVSNCFALGALTIGTENGNYKKYPITNATVSNSYTYIDETITADQVKGGYLAYIMQGDGSDENNTWGQNLSAEGDDYPVLNGDEVYLHEDKYYNASAIVARNLALNQSFKYNVYAITPEAGKMVFTLNGVEAEVVGEPVENSDAYVYVFNGIAPQFIDSEIKYTLYLGDEAIETKTDTILQYCEELYGSRPEFKDLIEKVYLYGKAARDYVVNVKKSYTEAELPVVTSDVINATTDVVPDYTGVPLSGEVAGASFYSANVFFDSTNSIVLKVKIANGVDPATVKVNDKAVSEPVDGVSTVRFDDIFASAYAESTEYKLTIDDVAGEQVLTYSVSIYAQRMATAASTDEMKALAAATYHYGVAAKAYADANK